MKAAQSFAIVFEGNVSNSVLKVGNGEELIQVGCPSEGCALDFLCKVEPLGLLEVLFRCRLFLPFFPILPSFFSPSLSKKRQRKRKRRRCREKKKKKKYFSFLHVVRDSLTAPSKSPRVVKTTPMLKWILAESAMGYNYEKENCGQK